MNITDLNWRIKKHIADVYKDVGKKSLTEAEEKSIKRLENEREWHKETRQKISAYKMLIGNAIKKNNKERVSEYQKKLNYIRDTRYGSRPLVKSLTEIDNDIRKIKGQAPYLLFDANVGPPIKISFTTLKKEDNPAKYILEKSRIQIEKIRERCKDKLDPRILEGLDFLSEDLYKTNIWFTEGKYIFGPRDEIEEEQEINNSRMADMYPMNFILNEDDHLLMIV